MSVNLEWITPEADQRIAWMARVSNVKARPDDPSERLIAYLINHKHWSPFEMAAMCVKIETTRDIGRQILRHRSFHFQEFSQRYAEVDDHMVYSKVRLQDTKNRQNSIITDDTELQEEWDFAQHWVFNTAYEAYKSSLAKGIAKEVARKLLPEGLTPTTLYMSGTLRDWLHYIAIRTDPATQLEHRDVAIAALRVLEANAPLIIKAAREAELIVN
jgi:thymidylate synthase (FAD)